MTTLDRDAATDRALHAQDDVEAYIRAICFKTGPPQRVGAELEWTVHHTAAPDAPLTAGTLRRALGPHTPATLDPSDPPIPLPSGAFLTAEPGGQLEISSAPAPSPAALHEAVSTDLRYLTRLLADAGLSLGEHGIDPHREPQRILQTPRYTAMERAFDARGPHGRVMMCSTAGLQACLDAGPAGELATRWAAVNSLGPPLIATFATSRRHAGRDTGWASARMGAWWGIDPRVSGPPGGPPDDPAAGWAAYALDAPLLHTPGVTLRERAAEGGLTTGDVDFHLSTLFPPVRPRGYLEVRYLDAQPGDDWIVPVALLIALLDDPQAALEASAPTAGQWVVASRCGLADPAIRRTAEAVADLAIRRLDRTGLPAPVRAHVTAAVQRRLQTQEQ